MLWFEDFPEGETRRFGDKLVTEEEVREFAREFDPQPQHLDAEAARETILGGLCASGWHTCAMLMRMMCDAFLCETASLGSPGIGELKWIKPVRPGDRLHALRTCLEARPSRSRPAMGLCRVLYDVRRQGDETVMTMECTHLLRRRPDTVPA